MKRLALGAVLLVAGGAASVGVACSNSDGTAAPPSDGGADSSASFALEVPCSDSVDAVYGDPGSLSVDKGTILKCTQDPSMSRDALEAAARKEERGQKGYDGKPFTSGARVYRVTYRTERGDGASSPGYTSALVFVPDTPRSGTLPVVVAAHGAHGQAPVCTPSKNLPETADLQPGLRHQVYPLVGAGYAVIAPDYAGYSNFGAPGNPLSAFASVKDIGKSIIDGSRALKKMLSKSLGTRVVLTGHSQGGHSAMSALYLADSYASDLEIAAVALYAPLWQPQRSWGALFLKPDTYAFAKSAGGAVSIWYHYSHAELLDGPGKGLELFAPDKRQVVKDFVEKQCWISPPYPQLAAAGASANDLFDPAYVDAIKGPAAGLGTCQGNATCEKWMARFLEDRPSLGPKAKQVPLYVSYGTADETITPDLMACVFDKLKSDGANFKVCVVPGETHGGIVSVKASAMSDWISATVMGQGQTPSCAADEKALVDDAGAPIQCNPLLPND